MRGWKYGSMYALPTDKPLGPPLKRWEETFSVVTALRAQFPGAFNPVASKAQSHKPNEGQRDE